MTEQARRPAIWFALEDLDAEAFAFCVTTLHQLARERGGFHDQAGLAALETACADYQAQSAAAPAK